MNYNEICEQVCSIARQAGAYIASEREVFDARNVEYKGDQNLVSYVDKQAERMIVSRLGDLIAQAAIIGEEGTADDNDMNLPNASHTWVIDPLDGTTNFIHGMPPYCVSIALMEADQVVVGVIYIVTSDECYYAWQGSKAYMNGREIRVSEVAKIENSLVISGLAYNLTDQEQSDTMRLFDHFNRHTNGARRIGSAAANLAYVASGKADCFYQVNLSSWDVAAGVLIVKQAGGRVTDYNGGDDCVFGKQLIATNNLLYTEFKNLITEN